VGMIDEVVRDFLDYYSHRHGEDGRNPKITGVWMTSDDGTEERDEVKAVEKIATDHDIPFKLWADEKFYIDEYVMPIFYTTTALDERLTLTVEIFRSRIFPTFQTFTQHTASRSSRSGTDPETDFLHPHNSRRFHQTYPRRKRHSKSQVLGMAY
jgi:hypothetical protein